MDPLGNIPTLRTSSAPTLEGSFDLRTEFRIWGVGLRFSFGFIELGGLRPVVESVHPNRAIREAPTVALHLCIYLSTRSQQVHFFSFGVPDLL